MNEERRLRLNTRISTPDGRVGTICYHHCDGYGGIWGEHEFAMPDGGFGDGLPAPDFMLRDKSVEELLRRAHRDAELECLDEWSVQHD